MIITFLKYRFSSILLLLFLLSCSNQKADAEVLTNSSNQNNTADLVQQQTEKKILVCAHRGDWRNAPENSIQSINLAIKMGVDIVEIDVRATKDNQLVLMHDEDIDRTTSGKGKVKNINFKDLQELHLINGIGSWTKHKVPTIKEALLFSKNKVTLNIDLKDFNQLDEVLELVENLDMLDQVLFKINGDLEKSRSVFKDNLNKIRFMPIVDLESENALEIVNKYLKSNIDIEAFELLVKTESDKFLKIKDLIKQHAIKIWINSLWANMCANHNDDRAIEDINTYQWYIDHEIDLIQTDRPQILLDYLKEKQLHN